MPGYQCGGCDGAEPADILITPLNGAETLAIGANCMPVTWCGILAGVLGIEAEQLWNAAVAIKAAQLAAEDQADDGADHSAPGGDEVLVPDGGQQLEGTADAATDGKAIRVTPHTPPARRPRRSTK